LFRGEHTGVKHEIPGCRLYIRSGSPYVLGWPKIKRLKIGDTLMATTNKTEMLAKLPVRPDEDPFVVAIGGFYRRWFNLVDDLQPMLDTVATLKGTEDEDWVPAWSAVAARYEKDAEAALQRGDKEAARNGFIQAKTYYSLARFPAPYHSGSPISTVSAAPPNCAKARMKSCGSCATARRQSVFCACPRALPRRTRCRPCW
jgi:hypothetical protein